MNRRGGELFLGLTLTLATLIVVFGILFLGRSGLLSGGMTVQVRAAEAAGIGVGDEVLFRGVVTGSVRDIRFTEDAVLLELRLEGRPPIPRDSPFVIRSTGVLGGREIEIRPGASGELLRSGDQVRGTVEPDLLAVAGRGVEEVGDRLQLTLAEATAILRDLQAGRGSLGRVLKDDQLYANLNETVLLLNRLLRDIQADPKKYFSFSVF